MAQVTGTDALIAKLEKPAGDSKKFVMALAGLLALAGCFIGAAYFGIDWRVLAILAFFAGLIPAGYVLGTAFLESVIGFAVVRFGGKDKPQLPDRYPE